MVHHLFHKQPSLYAPAEEYEDNACEASLAEILWYLLQIPCSQQSVQGHRRDLNNVKSREPCSSSAEIHLPHAFFLCFSALSVHHHRLWFHRLSPSRPDDPAPVFLLDHGYSPDLELRIRSNQLKIFGSPEIAGSTFLEKQVMHRYYNGKGTP